MVRKHKTQTRRMRGGGAMPITTWGNTWAQLPGALAWSSTTQAPLPLANGGLYTGAQSTGAWASHPMPATQYAFAVEAARTAGNPEVFFHQRPNDNMGASFSPYVGMPYSPQHYSATMGVMMGGKRRRATKRNRRHK